MPEIDPQVLRDLSDGIVADVAPKMEEAMPIIPEIRELDQMLMVSVDISLASAHILASGYMIEMIQGAAECFNSLNTALAETAQSWEDSDGAVADSFK
ncbi:hypothetical protein [Glycomyces dulcitolivorans]|uniref:hypothetical protein n=1 Tax=Glycomyces dulcitolivorans TaxID=2200759 RepID=UPI000DD48581|nr:hypothetical protein [Glycomyces dulcitolivorans]